jgi:hypothetical protein
MSSDAACRENPAGPRPDNTEAGNPGGGSRLFLLRVWLEAGPQAGGDTDGTGKEEAPRWHGKVQHVVRGEAYAFTGWDMMIACIEAMLMRDLAGPAQATAKQHTPEILANKDKGGGIT